MQLLLLRRQGLLLHARLVRMSCGRSRRLRHLLLLRHQRFQRCLDLLAVLIRTAAHEALSVGSREADAVLQHRLQALLPHTGREGQGRDVP